MNVLVNVLDTSAPACDYTEFGDPITFTTIRNLASGNHIWRVRFLGNSPNFKMWMKFKLHSKYKYELVTYYYSFFCSKLL
jgi:hypothetical protein